MSDGVRCLWMRGGTSKGGFFLAGDLPADAAARDAFLLQVMGSPDPRQIDGMGGGDPLTSKVAVIRRSARPGVDVDYLFLQVFVDRALVSDAQNCGNILAGIGPFAIERGLVTARDPVTAVSIFMENTGQIAVAAVCTPAGAVTYAGDARIDGVPGTAAPVALAFADVAGSSCGALLPTGRACDTVEGYTVTLIDNGMPCVILHAPDAGVTGYETCQALDANARLKADLERLRLVAGRLMGLGDVADKTVPKMVLVSAPASGGAVNTRCFIPHRCHASIGVFAATSVAAACLIDGSPAAAVARVPDSAPISAPISAPTSARISVEHPSGETTCVIERDESGRIVSSSIVRTARKLFDGLVFGH